jgi:hypothetical protein
MDVERASSSIQGERSMWPGYDDLLITIRRKGFATIFKPSSSGVAVSHEPTQGEFEFDTNLWRRMTCSIDNCIGAFVIEDNLFLNLTRSVDAVSIKQFLGRRFTRRAREGDDAAESRVEVRLVSFPSGISQCIFFKSNIKRFE